MKLLLLTNSKQRTKFRLPLFTAGKEGEIGLQQALDKIPELFVKRNNNKFDKMMLN